MSDNVFNREFLVLCRHIRQMSQSALSKAAGITQGHLSKIEQGVFAPTSEVAQSLAKALQFPDSLFYQRERPYGLPVSVHPMFRKRASVGKKELDRILADMNFRILHIKNLLKSIEFEQDFELPFCDIDAFNGDIEEITRIVRANWLLPPGPVENLVEYIERSGCIVSLCNFNRAEIDGFTVHAPGVPPCIFINQDRPADRMRYTLAHELGHLVMHSVPSPDMESEANRFASALLMPASDIAPYLSKMTIKKLAFLKTKWKVSMAALLMRAADLGKVTANQSRYLWMNMAKKGYRTREPDELDFEVEQPTILDDFLQLHRNELGYSFDDLCSMIHLYSDDFYHFYDSTTPHLRTI